MGEARWKTLMVCSDYQHAGMMSLCWAWVHVRVSLQKSSPTCLPVCTSKLQGRVCATSYKKQKNMQWEREKVGGLCRAVCFVLFTQCRWCPLR